MPKTPDIATSAVLDTIVGNVDVAGVQKTRLISIDDLRTQLGVSSPPVVVMPSGASISTAGNETYTAAQLLNGIIVRDCAGGDRTDTLPSAASLVAAIADAEVGHTARCYIANGSDADETITLAVPASGSFVAAQTATSRVIPWKTSKYIHVRLTNVGSGTEAYVAYV